MTKWLTQLQVLTAMASPAQLVPRVIRATKETLAQMEPQVMNSSPNADF